MKKFNLLRPCLNMAFGTLLVFTYLNLLSTGDAASIVLGVIALIFGLTHIAVGVLEILMENKLPDMAKDILQVCSVAMYPTFVFVVVLIAVIQAGGNIAPAGWILAIIMLASSLGLAALYAIYYFLRNKVLRPFVFLAAILFAVSCLLDLVFTFNGNARALGDITLVELLLYGAYAGLVLFAFRDKERFGPTIKAGEEEPVSDPEPVPEEEPAPEEPAEEPEPEESEPEEPKPEEE